MVLLVVELTAMMIATIILTSVAGTFGGQSIASDILATRFAINDDLEFLARHFVKIAVPGPKQLKNDILQREWSFFTKISGAHQLIIVVAQKNDIKIRA